ncbi:hypothetical protein [Pandoraea sp. NPDC087047]|uniref:hypothetical protein n=1 Tax=Pandoraea sp. NPDC087047 TaxID=3364390 RepID=UPI0037FF6491
MWYQQCAGTSGWGQGASASQRMGGATDGQEPQGLAELPGMRGALAGRRVERPDLVTRLTQAANAVRNARLNGVEVPRRVDPDLARAFAGAWAGLWVTTGPCQHFYRKEFNLAHERDARLAQNQQQVESTLALTHGGRDRRAVDIAVEQVCGDVASWLETIAATGDRGWRFRAARDAMSLAGNLSLLAIIAACFYQAQNADDDAAAHHGRGVEAANTPFGVPWADWTLLALEGAKGVVTQSLGSPTLIRHHAVDEVLKRMDAGCRLLEACVALPLPSKPSAWRGTLGKLTLARDVATLFTFANSAVPPARLGLWAPSWFSGASTTRDGYRGILRVAGLMLDSCRAVTSLLGTWARNEGFTLDARGLTRRWEALCERLATVPEDDRATVLGRVAHVTQLASLCDTQLLAKIASQRTLREHLLSSSRSLTASEIAQTCEQFEVQCHASCVDGSTYLSLNPAESPWGHRWRDEAWQMGAATPARASYRLLLLYQHWSAALLERAVSASSCTSETQDTGRPDDDPLGVTRTRSGVTHIDIRSTRV